MSHNNEKQNKEWFHKLKLNSWEVEILIVGFVLVMLFQVVGSLDFKYYIYFYSGDLESGENYRSWLLYIAQFAGLMAVSSTVNILIYSFGIYIAFRGFWVGVLGLSSVFPDGIKFKNLNFKNKLSLNKDKYDLTNFINYIDKICSSIFSFSFLISFSIVSLILFFIQFLCLAIGLDFIAMNYLNSNIADILFEVLYFIYFLAGLLFFIDFFLFSLLKHIAWKPFSFVFYYINKYFRITLLVFLYDHIYYIFISNIKRRYLFFILFLFFLISFFYKPLNDEKYFPPMNSKTNNVMSYYNYQNQFKFIEFGTEGSYPEQPFIHSDVISKKYLKLYIPYTPLINESLRNLCPEIPIINDVKDDAVLEQNVLDCINEHYIISINEEKIDNDFIFYHYAYEYIKLPTFFMIVPLENIDNGKHILNISKITIKNDVQTDREAGDIDFTIKPNTEFKVSAREEKVVIVIPFYLQKD
tara:strand:- start:607 stop:2013 length:1407 start_codon:yes stop_codon:yes gene_type:complete